MTGNGVMMVYVTCASAEEAKAIATALLEQKLIACANIMPAHQSFYRWKDKVQDETETGLILKTRQALFETVRQAVCARHSYDTPCIVAWPLSAGHVPFLDWIAAETIL